MPELKPSHSKIQEIISLLRDAHETLLLKRRVAIACLFLSVLLGGLSLLILLESRLFLNGTVKTAAIGIVLLLALFIPLFFPKKVRVSGFNRFYEHFFTRSEKKKVLSAVDLFLDQQQKHSRFYQAAITSNIGSVTPDDLKKELKSYSARTPVHKAFRMGIALVASVALSSYLVIATHPDGTARTVHFWSGYTQPNPYTYQLTPADTTVEHGSSLQAIVRFPDENVPENIILEFKTDVEEEYRQRQMHPVRTTVFSSPEIDLINNISYRVVMDGFTSREYRVDVRLQPRFDELVATMTPPSYTGLPRDSLEYPFSRINIYPGTQIRFAGVTNKPLQTLIVSGRHVQEVIEPENTAYTRFTFPLIPGQDDTLRFEMEDGDGLANRNPFTTHIHLLVDQVPVVRILEPSGTVMETEPEQIDIFYQATDDFGLTGSELYWEHQRAFVDEPEIGSLSLDGTQNGRTAHFSWDLNGFELRPRDQLTFRIRVWDNNEIAGYQMGESQPVQIQIPSLTEYFEELDNRERDVAGELDKISENFNEMEREYQEFLKRLRQNPEAGFEEQQILEEIQQRQESIDNTVRELNEKFEQMRSEIERDNRVSPETQQAYRELQQLMNELDDPALREAMEELRQALEDLTQQNLEEALENVSFNEQLYRERIERTVELFKRLKMNSDLDRLARQYEDMAERMRDNPAATNEQFSREIQTVREDLDQVSEQIEQLDNNPPKRSGETLKQLKQEGRQGLEDISRRVDELMDHTSDNENGSGTDREASPSEPLREQQQQIGEQMQAEAERFRSAISDMGGQQIQVNMLALQRALYTLLELSEQQEYLARNASETRNRSQGFVDLARTQNSINEQFSLVADTLFQISTELPGIPNQINRKKLEIEQYLNRARDQMVERSQRGATVATRESLGGLNDLSSLVASLIDQLLNQQNGGMGSGMSMQQMVEQLQNMSGDQQQLNQQLQELINDVQGDRLTREQSDRLDQIARQQNEIRRQLRELQQSGSLDQGDRLLSEFQRTVEEMEEAINDMRGGVTDPLMVERQQNILSRMLNAEESLQRRGEEEERQGTSALEYERVLPPEMTLEELRQEIRARMQDPDFTRFSEEYQRLIERYFDQLRRFENVPVP